MAENSASRLREVAFYFLRLGVTAFGGPAVHIAMMYEDVVNRRAWLTREEFLDLVGATNLIPGPNSTEMAIHIGHRRAGWPGLFAAGICFLVPPALIVAALAWAYVHFGALPAATSLLYGAKPAIIAIVAIALWSLGRTALRSPRSAFIAAACLAAALAGANELLILAGGAALGAWRPGVSAAFAALPAAALPSPAPFALPTLFGVFAKAGSVLFGSGYVLFAFIRADFVERLGWLTEAQLLDAIAVGQVTPGPLFTAATFIGYLLGGPSGAAVATAGIFLPAFFFVALSGPLVPRIRRSPLAGAMLDGVNAASLALMAAVLFTLARTALTGPLTFAIAAAAAAALLLWRPNPVWLLAAGAATGWLTSK
jgi:chromate transporter